MGVTVITGRGRAVAVADGTAAEITAAPEAVSRTLQGLSVRQVHGQSSDQSTVSALQVAGVIRARDAQRTAIVPRERLGDRLTVLVSGTVYTPMMPSVVGGLLRDGSWSAVDVVVTESARHFVVPKVFEYLGATTWRSSFRSPRNAHVRAPHIYLGAARMILAMPASANIIARLASGEGSDLASLVVLAAEGPVVVVPAMNGRMWAHPAVRRNVSILRDLGYYIVEPGEGLEVERRGEPTREYGGIGVTYRDLAGALAWILADHALTRPQEPVKDE